MNARDEPGPGWRSHWGRHWRGDLNLAVSVWLNGLLAVLALAGAYAVLDRLSDAFPHDLRIQAGTVFAGWFLRITLSVWLLVGIWRAAAAHAARRGGRGAVILARILAALILLNLVGTVRVAAIPQMREIIAILHGDTAAGPFEVRLADDGRELWITGGISFQLVDRVKPLLTGAPDLRRVYLNSGGGRTGPAMGLARMIRARGLDTQVSGDCLSACTLIFLGGVRRIIGAEARLGFHAADLPGWSAAAVAEHNRDQAALMVDMGVDPAFAAKATTYPHGEMWFPATETLLRAGVISQIGN